MRAQAGRFAGRDDVLATSRGEITTAELVACERRLIAAAVGRAGEGTGIVDSSLARAWDRQRRPSADRRAGRAVRATLSTGHGVNVIEALAGTGKTYTAGVLRRGLRGRGLQVLGVAPTAARHASSPSRPASRRGRSTAC